MKRKIYILFYNQEKRKNLGIKKLLHFMQKSRESGILYRRLFILFLIFLFVVLKRSLFFVHSFVSKIKCIFFLLLQNKDSVQKGKTPLLRVKITGVSKMTTKKKNKRSKLSYAYTSTIYFLCTVLCCCFIL